MKFGIWFVVIILSFDLAVGQTPAPTAPATNPVAVTFSAQQSPFPLPKGIMLWSAEACVQGAIRTISAAQIRQAAEGTGIAWQDPALNSGLLTTASSKTPTSRSLSAVKWSSVGIGVATGIVSYIKSQATNVGNQKTWTEVSIIGTAIGAGIAVLQPVLQSDVNTQAVAITNGVQAALISDMTNLYSVPAGGCSKSLMFFAVGGSVGIVAKGVIP